MSTRSRASFLLEAGAMRTGFPANHVALYIAYYWHEPGIPFKIVSLTKPDPQI